MTSFKLMIYLSYCTKVICLTNLAFFKKKTKTTKHFIVYSRIMEMMWLMCFAFPSTAPYRIHEEVTLLLAYSLPSGTSPLWDRSCPHSCSKEFWKPGSFLWPWVKWVAGPAWLIFLLALGFLKSCMNVFIVCHCKEPWRWPWGKHSEAVTKTKRAEAVLKPWEMKWCDKETWTKSSLTHWGMRKNTVRLAKY